MTDDCMRLKKNVVRDGEIIEGMRGAHVGVNWLKLALV